MDETCEIKATAFNAAVDVLFDKFEEGKVSKWSKEWKGLPILPGLLRDKRKGEHCEEGVL